MSRAARRVGPAPVVKTLAPAPPPRVIRDEPAIEGARAAAAMLTGESRPNLTPPPAASSEKKRSLFRRR